MGRLFGTDGVRGVANSELTCELAFNIGKAVAFVLTRETQHKPKFLIGKDTRISGDMLEAALSAGICSAGGDVVSLGVIPTPGVAYLTTKYSADAGIVISASHNSAEYNGIKIFNSNGYKLRDDIEERIESIILDGAESLNLPVGDAVGTVKKCVTAIDDYTSYALKTVNCDLSGMKIVIDCANGAATYTAPSVLSSLGAEIFVIHDKPNGTNINLGCGSTHTESLSKEVTARHADIGLAFDGDADRLLVVDNNGRLVDGDKIMLVCSEFLLKEGLLTKSTLVTTVMTNLGLVLKAKELGINIVQTKVGDRYVLEEMLKSGYTIGGEASGHIIFLNYSTTGDGLVSALQLLSILKRSGQMISVLSDVFKPMPQVIINAKVKNSLKSNYSKDKVIMDEIALLESEFLGKGRVLVRESGTEPCVRVMIEGEDFSLIEQKAGMLARLIEARLG